MDLARHLLVFGIVARLEPQPPIQLALELVQLWCEMDSAKEVFFARMIVDGDDELVVVADNVAARSDALAKERLGQSRLALRHLRKAYKMQSWFQTGSVTLREVLTSREEDMLLWLLCRAIGIAIGRPLAVRDIGKALRKDSACRFSPFEAFALLVRGPLDMYSFF